MILLNVGVINFFDHIEELADGKIHKKQHLIINIINMENR
jgi:hypothetical protein